MKKVGVALLGLGTVGGGTYRILKSQHDAIMKNYGIDIEIRHILEKDMAKVAALGIDPNIVSCDISNVTSDNEISIVAEFFGGIEPAKSFLAKSLEAGKSIVTANKEMFSKHWAELETAAAKTGAGLYFEASCVGGVPIIRALEDSCQGNCEKASGCAVSIYDQASDKRPHRNRRRGRHHKVSASFGIAAFRNERQSDCNDTRIGGAEPKAVNEANDQLKRDIGRKKVQAAANQVEGR
jgi:hypothetical protein